MKLENGKWVAEIGDEVVIGNKTITVVSDTTLSVINQFVAEFKEEVLLVGGCTGYVGAAGLLCANCSNVSSYLNRNIGVRLHKLETKYSVEITGVRYEKETDECFYKIKHNNEVLEVKIM